MYEVSELERSWLFVPGDRPERFTRAFASGSDAVVLDLEDSVHTSKKELACNSVLEFLESAPVSTVWLRPSRAVPRHDSPELPLLRHRAVRGVVLPKVESDQQVRLAQDLFVSNISLVILIESARALVKLSEISRVNGVTRLALGSLDLLSDLRATSSELIKYSLIQLVVWSREADIPPPIAGVTANIHGLDDLERETKEAISLGCFGKLCIHPSQVPIVNGLHSPTEQAVEWAKEVLLRATKDGVFVYEGKMIDAPMVLKAESILRLKARGH